MARGSFASGALVDLSTEDVRRMLGLDETLFVEHKANLGQDSANQVIKAVASFANTLGGWLLIGIEDGRPSGNESSWTGDESLPLVDVVRDRLRGEIDPLPAFEARVFHLDEGAVGVACTSRQTRRTSWCKAARCSFARSPAIAMPQSLASREQALAVSVSTGLSRSAVASR